MSVIRQDQEEYIKRCANSYEGLTYSMCGVLLLLYWLDKADAACSVHTVDTLRNKIPQKYKDVPYQVKLTALVCVSNTIPYRQYHIYIYIFLYLSVRPSVSNRG